MPQRIQGNQPTLWARMKAAVSGKAKTGAQKPGGVMGGGSSIPGFDTSKKTLQTYRSMRANPTIALARAAATCPIVALGWSYEESEDAPAGAAEFIEHQLDPLRKHLVGHGLRALDYGWSPFEMVWQPVTVDKAERLGIRKAKPLLVDITEILSDRMTGQYAGLRQKGVDLLPEATLLFSYDQEAGNLYGRARMENCRKPWERWEGIDKQQGRYCQKVGGVIPMIEYPEGETKDEHGADVDNFDHAKRVLRELGQGHGVVMPNKLAQYAEDLLNRGVDINKLKAWHIGFLETKQRHGVEFVAQMRHEESLMARGWLMPERAITEGQYGTKAEAESQTDLAMVVAEQDSEWLVETVNAYLVDRLLVWNWGPEAAGSVWVSPEPLSNPAREMLRGMMTKLLSEQPALFEKWVAIDAVFDQLGLPKAADDLDQLQDGGDGDVDPEIGRIAASLVSRAFRGRDD